MPRLEIYDPRYWTRVEISESMLIRGKEATGAASIYGTLFGHWETAPLPVPQVI